MQMCGHKVERSEDSFHVYTVDTTQTGGTTLARAEENTHKQTHKMSSLSDSVFVSFSLTHTCTLHECTHKITFMAKIHKGVGSQRQSEVIWLA